MTASRTVTFAALLLLAACTKTGEAGPRGPQGDTGGSGTSVTSVQLDVGDPTCPNGGSEFTSTSGVTYACNGAEGGQGTQGPAGPRLVIKTAAGVVLGLALPGTYGEQLVGYLGNPPCYYSVVIQTGEMPFTQVYFDQAGCTGSAHTSALNPTYAAAGYGSSRVFTPATPYTRGSRAYSSLLRYDLSAPGCYDVTGTLNDSYLVVELPIHPPFPAPLVMAYE